MCNCNKNIIILHIFIKSPMTGGKLNYLWSVLIISGIIVGCFNGTLSQVSDGILTSSKEAIELCILMVGIVGVWNGILNVANCLGMTKKLEKIIQPLIHLIFYDVKSKKAKEYISLNIVANILGLGWAATPSGIQAMKELKKESGPGNTASNAMCNLLIINISSLQLIPINIIAYRSQYGSLNPMKILLPSILATSVSTIAAILFCMAMRRK